MLSRKPPMGNIGGTIVSAMIFVLFAPSLAFAQWTQTHGPDGGFVQSLASSGSVLYATAGGGIFRSTDNGSTWSIKDYNSPPGVSRLFVDGAYLYTSTTGGFLSSTDDGASWSQGGNGLPAELVSALLPLPNALYAITDFRHIFRSTDHGAHWMEADSGVVRQGTGQAHYIFGLVGRGSRLFAATYYGVYHSDNEGQSWREANQGLSDTKVSAVAVKDTMLFAGTYIGGVFLSTNGGASWSPTNTSLLSQVRISSFAICGDSVYAATEGKGTFLSTDNGTNWFAVNNGLSNSKVLGLLLAPTGLFANTWQGIFRSTDGGGMWFATNTGISNATVYDLFPSPSGVYAGTAAMGAFLSTDHGLSWQSRSGGIMENTVYGDVFAFAHQGPYMFAGTYNDAFRSADQGATWTRLGITTGNLMAFAVTDSAIFAAWSGVSRSKDSGATWTQVIRGLTDGVYALAAKGTTLLAGSSWAGVFRSTNNGENWSSATGTYLQSTQSLLVADSNYYAGTFGDGILRSTDDGSSWQSVGVGLGNANVWDLASVGGMVFAGTDYGVYASSDHGASWANVTTVGVDCRICCLAVIDGDLYAGTVQRGVWRRPLSEMLTSVDEPTIAGKVGLSLDQNYPNPFNPSTTIRYGIPVRSHVSLAVYNTLGQQVAQLVNGEVEAGYHVVSFDAAGLPSGVYFYRMQAGPYVQAKKLTIVR